MRLQKLVISGMELDVYSQDIPQLELPVCVLFVQHALYGDRRDARHFADRALKRAAREQKAARDLIVVAIDMRNHGSRLINIDRNGYWHSNPAKHNGTFAVDMFAMQAGTADDISLLIDYLPTYLYPYGERTIEKWGVTGWSLGGVSAWTCLKNDPRITYGIPIAAWTKYLTYVARRAEHRGYGFVPAAPHLPAHFVQHLASTDLIHTDFSTPTHPLARKDILVLVGTEDEPVLASSNFFKDKWAMDEANGGRLRVNFHEGIEHFVMPKMLDELADFVWETGLAPSTPKEKPERQDKAVGTPPVPVFVRAQL